MSEYTHKIKVTIDKEIMEEYRKIYFIMNPRCKKFPKYFENPIPPSWNSFIAKIRMEQATIKSRYKEFAMWLSAKYKLAGLNLDKATFSFEYFFKTNQRHDIDNYTLGAKLINDGFTQAKVLVDDNSSHLELKFPPHKHDKENPRLEIWVEY